MLWGHSMQCNGSSANKQKQRLQFEGWVKVSSNYVSQNRGGLPPPPTPLSAVSETPSPNVYILQTVYTALYSTQYSVNTMYTMQHSAHSHSSSVHMCSLPSSLSDNSWYTAYHGQITAVLLYCCTTAYHNQIKQLFYCSTVIQHITVR